MKGFSYFRIYSLILFGFLSASDSFAGTTKTSCVSAAPIIQLINDDGMGFTDPDFLTKMRDQINGIKSKDEAQEISECLRKLNNENAAADKQGEYTAHTIHIDALSAQTDINNKWNLTGNSGQTPTTARK
jgi:hypothetical protein